MAEYSPDVSEPQNVGGLDVYERMTKANETGEHYNKPRLEYRDEVFVILLINGWELLLKAVISKARGSIYYPKRRGQPYKTLSWQDALLHAKELSLWPDDLPWQAIQANLRPLTTYRDNAVHFYNAEGFGALTYGLAHTAIKNFSQGRVWHRPVRRDDVDVAAAGSGASD